MMIYVYRPVYCFCLLLLPYFTVNKDFRVLFNCFRVFHLKKYIYILALEMASPAAQGTSTVPIVSVHYRSLYHLRHCSNHRMRILL